MEVEATHLGKDAVVTATNDLKVSKQATICNIRRCFLQIPCNSTCELVVSSRKGCFYYTVRPFYQERNMGYTVGFRLPCLSRPEHSLMWIPLQVLLKQVSQRFGIYSKIVSCQATSFSLLAKWHVSNQCLRPACQVADFHVSLFFHACQVACQRPLYCRTEVRPTLSNTFEMGPSGRF